VIVLTWAHQCPPPFLPFHHGRQRGKGDGSEGESSSVIEYRPPSTEMDDLFFDIGTMFDCVRGRPAPFQLGLLGPH